MPGKENKLLTGWEEEQEALTISVGNGNGRIIQITDPHIFKDDNGCLLGLETRKSLRAIVEDIQKKNINADLILATGDISQDQSAESYQFFSEIMGQFETPVCWIPGNHDDVFLMTDHLLADNISRAKIINLGKWQLILLDSSVRGKVQGCLGEEQRSFLKKSLQSSQSTYTMPVLHHHPVDINCQWLDPLGLEDSEMLFEILDTNPSVKGLLWGHIHQIYDQYRGDIRMLATPSSSVQFKPLSEEFAADTESPGYRVLELEDDGTITTQVHRIEHIDFTVDYSVKGY